MKYSIFLHGKSLLASLLLVGVKVPASPRAFAGTALSRFVSCVQSATPPIPKLGEPMRLTLRTLLAFRDKTLHSQDAESLSAKVRASSFAQSLLEGVGKLLSNTELSAPSPIATDPTNDPNVMAGYLDSTLSPEQAAEIDRTCLESPVHLAEAAETHEILTLILKERAEVSQDLRRRVYQIQQIMDTAVADEKESPRRLENAVGTITVTPVQAEDSGAFQAASRLEQQAAHADSRTLATQTASGEESLRAPMTAAEASEMFADRTRSRRVTAWLVTLGLIAAFLLVVKQAFDPLLTTLRGGTGEAVVAPLAGDQTETETEPAESTEPTESTESTESTEPAEPDEPTEPDQPTSQPRQPTAQAPGTTEPAPTAEHPPGIPGVDMQVEPQDSPDTEVADPQADLLPPQSDTAPAALGVVGNSQWILARVADTDPWQSLPPETVLDELKLLAVPPPFRSRIIRPEAWEAEFLGPALARLRADRDNETQLELQRGRVVITAERDAVPLEIADLEGDFLVQFQQTGQAVAIDVFPFRAPGTDPLNPENRMFVTQLQVLVGPIHLHFSEQQIELQTGQSYMRVGGGSFQEFTATTPWQWLDARSESPIQREAKENLLSLISAEEPILLGLQQASQFRRVEVAALAVQTMALLGNTEPYFGGKGKLSDPAHKSYWQDHVKALKAAIDFSPQGAATVRANLAAMDAANAAILFRLLWDYSPEQVEAGADAQLVEFLDSPQMAIRVLALESLRRMTGTTLFFKAEQENTSRRRPEIKKWETRLRRGDIRWQSLPLPGIEVPQEED